MTNYTKIGLPTLLLLVFLTSCSPSDFTPDYKPSLVEPTSTINYEGKTTDTLQPTSETITPEPEQSTPVVVEKPCLENTGELRAFEIPRGDETLTGNIYTPPCYHETGLSYPTLYLLHGATETEQQWEDLGLVEVVDGLIAREDIPPLIIVMPREDTWISLQDNPYGDYLIQALIPWIDTEYRTLPERHYRAVGGISRGGNWALRLGLLHWGTFGSLGAHSAPLFYGDLNRLPG